MSESKSFCLDGDAASIIWRYLLPWRLLSFVCCYVDSEVGPVQSCWLAYATLYVLFQFFIIFLEFAMTDSDFGSVEINFQVATC